MQVRHERLRGGMIRAINPGAVRYDIWTLITPEYTVNRGCISRDRLTACSGRRAVR